MELLRKVDFDSGGDIANVQTKIFQRPFFSGYTQVVELYSRMVQLKDGFPK